MPGGAGQVLDVDFADLASSGITTIAELAAAAVAVTVASNREEFPRGTGNSPAAELARIPGPPPHPPAAAPLCGTPSPTLAGGGAESHPSSCLSLPRGGTAAPGLAPAAGDSCTWRPLSVRQATQAQLEDVQGRRQQRHADFVGLVLAPSGRPAPAARGV